MPKDIKAKGLLRPIILYEGKILDGRNRYLACQIAGVEPRFVQWSGKGSPLQWVISENLVRRHLTSSQRAVVAHDLLPLLEKEAKDRQRLSAGRGKKVCNNLHTLTENGRSREAAAKITKTNHTYVQAVKTIDAQAPELLDRIRSGVLKVPDAARLARLPLAERKALLKRCDGVPLDSGDLHNLLNEVRKEHRQKAAVAFARSSKSSGNQGIIVGDMDLLWKRVREDSVDLFLTDPPYAEIESYERLAELAAAKLKPGGLCLAYSGQFYLPEVMAAMSQHLTYWWTFAIQFGGSHCAVHARNVQNKWKPILAFAKPPVKKAPNWLSDLLEGGGRDKEHHDWGQDESEVEYLIQRLTEPGQLVVEPFCGGGQIPAACKATGRRWLATEINGKTALVARKRLAEMSGGKRPVQKVSISSGSTCSRSAINARVLG